MEYEQILREQHGEVVLLTLNRPDRLNAWTFRMSAELVDAIEAADADDSVGAVVVKQGQVVAVAHNERETGHDPTAHAEIVALRRAARALGSWRLIDAELYVTMEPCPMCAGALVNARIARVHYGCHDPKAGAVRTLYQILDDARLNHRVDVNPGLLAEESAALLKSFFARLRTPPAGKP